MIRATYVTLYYGYFAYIYSGTFFIQTIKTIIMNYYEQLKQLILGIEEDFIKFYEKENGAAGTRVRKAMQDLKVLAQDIRTDVQNIKNSD